MLSKSYVHIGMAKTGTTSIQRGLYAMRRKLERERVCYPDVGGGNHGRPVGSLFVDNPERWPPNVRLRVDVEWQNKAATRQLERASASPDFDTLILSGEAFFTLNTDAIERFWTWLKSSSEEVRILVYFREPKEWANSNVQQSLKTGKTLESILSRRTPAPQIRSRLERWIQVCGKDRISVFDFNTARQHPNGVGGHFVEQVGLGHLADKMARFHTNQSISADALRRIGELNLSRRLTAKERAEIVSTTDDTTPFSLPDATLAEVERASKADVEWLAAEFGVQLT